jgi:hypothetical protein
LALRASASTRSTIHQPGGLEPGRRACRLAAIAAILGASAGLDRQKTTDLHSVGIEIFPVNRLRLKEQIVEWKIIDNFCIIKRKASCLCGFSMRNLARNARFNREISGFFISQHPAPRPID